MLLSSGLLDVVAAPDPKPDVIVEELEYNPPRVLPGGSLQLRSVVRNQGDLSAGPFVVGFHLSVDQQLDAGDRLVGERSILQLGIGFGAAQSYPYTIPVDVPEGYYYVIADADRFDALDESDEDNNVFVAPGRVEVYVPPPPAPDLAPTAVAATSDTVSAGGSFDAQDTVRNSGDLTAGSFRVAFYLSDDATVDEADLLLGWRTVPSLAAGADSSGTTQLFVPAGTAAGTWTLGAIVDDLDAVNESDEDDNVLAASQTLEVQ